MLNVRVFMYFYFCTQNAHIFVWFLYTRTLQRIAFTALMLLVWRSFFLQFFSVGFMLYFHWVNHFQLPFIIIYTIYIYNLEVYFKNLSVCHSHYFILAAWYHLPLCHSSTQFFFFCNSCCCCFTRVKHFIMIMIVTIIIPVCIWLRMRWQLCVFMLVVACGTHKARI